MASVTVVGHISPMAYRIDILVVNGVLDSALAVSLDVMSAANRIATHLGHALPFEWQVIAPQRSIITGTGRATKADCVIQPRANSACDVLLVLGMNVPLAAEMSEAMQRRDVKRAVMHVRFSRAKMICASCSGTFLCAEAGRLDAKSATTSWWLAPAFRARYPTTDVSNEQMIVRDGNMVTAGAAFAHIDLMLWMVRHLAGPTVAQTCARYLIVDERASQSRYVAYDQLSHESPQLTRVESFVRKNLSKPIRVSAMAKACGLSTRTLERQMKLVTGLSPIRFVQRIRIEQAVHLAQTTKLSVAEITHKTGYANETSLRRILVREYGMALHAIRRR
jgi:transcriptional regulator GlxA family with amidase domain